MRLLLQLRLLLLLLPLRQLRLAHSSSMWLLRQYLLPLLLLLQRPWRVHRRLPACLSSRCSSSWCVQRLDAAHICLHAVQQLPQLRLLLLH
jgi:hypothetical protein